MSVNTAVLLERDTFGLPLAERLVRAAGRVDAASSAGPSSARDAYALRPDQTRVFADLARFLLDVATRPDATAADGLTRAPLDLFGRVVLPPRTGKTLIAAHMIARSGLCTTFIVPTRTLVEQAARELAARLPGVPIGVYFSDRSISAAEGGRASAMRKARSTALLRSVPDSFRSRWANWVAALSITSLFIMNSACGGVTV